MHLVEKGAIALDAPVRTYLPELRLADEETACRVTVRHLLTHTGGWQGDFFEDTGRGDDALALFVARMANLPQLTPLGQIWNYNNAALSVAGRVIEAVVQMPYEIAVRDLLLEPLGMRHSFFFPEEVMLHSFAVGHNVVDGKPVVASPWPVPRSINPAGGLSSSAHDQLAYARFHLGIGVGSGDEPVLSGQSLKLMQTPSIKAEKGGWTGIAWFIQDRGGLRTISHGGSTNGQQSSFLLMPERQFALTILTNATTGSQLHTTVESWALEHYLGVKEPERRHLQRAAGELRTYAGRYAAAFTLIDLRLENDTLVLAAHYIDFPADDPPAPPSPTPVAFSDADTLACLEGELKGVTGEFIRDQNGRIAWLRFGGRLHQREA